MSQVDTLTLKEKLVKSKSIWNYKKNNEFLKILSQVLNVRPNASLLSFTN